MNPSAIAIVLAIFFILAMFWHSLRANTQAASAAPELGASGAAAGPPPNEWLTSRGEGEAIDLRQFFHTLQEGYETTLSYLGIRLELELPAMALTVAVRGADLRRLFAHIIRVVSDAPARGMTLRILARSDGAQAVVNCVDTGPGEPRLAAAFDWPDRLRIASVETCHSIVDIYGGRIYTAPSPLGQRSLTLRFPLRRIGVSVNGSR